MELLYRFRSPQAVLEGFQELERQEIYFSSLHDLNDPMEGFKEIFWRGDRDLWTNLLDHYALILLHTSALTFMKVDQLSVTDLEGLVFSVPDTLPAAPVRVTFGQLIEKLRASSLVSRFVSAVSDRQEGISRAQLTSYLQLLHPHIVSILFDTLAERDLLPTDKGGKFNFEQLKALASRTGSALLAIFEAASSRFFSSNYSSEVISQQLALLAHLRALANNAPQPLIFMTIEYPEAYVKAICSLTHVPWSVACFSKTPLNSSMWGTYGSGHTGVCLIFKTHQSAGNLPHLEIERITSWSADASGTRANRSFVKSPFIQVRYGEDFQPVDFFKSLGRIQRQHLNGFWYRTSDGSAHPYCTEVDSTNTEWFNNYWDVFEKSTDVKLPEWGHEQECRLTMYSLLDELTKPGDRKAKFRFCDLEGIIFGLKTSNETKVAIMDIIYRKCRTERRDEFKFYQMSVDAQNRTMRSDLLSLISKTPRQ